MDYLKEFKLSAPEQGIGWQEGILVQIQKIMIDWYVSLWKGQTDLQKSPIGFLPLDVFKDPLFYDEPWVCYFANGRAPNNEALCSLDTVKQILVHCTRLSQLKAFK